MSKTHLLCYIKRKLLTSWKLDSLERGTRDHSVLAYGSDDPTFARFAKKGNVLWVIGAYPDGPPTLEAKIEISGVLSKDPEYNCDIKGSRSGSGFLGLNDASDTVMQLVFKSNKSLWSLRDKYSSTVWKSIYGRNFQSPRMSGGAVARQYGQKYSSGVEIDSSSGSSGLHLNSRTHVGQDLRRNPSESNGKERECSTSVIDNRFQIQPHE